MTIVSNPAMWRDHAWLMSDAHVWASLAQFADAKRSHSTRAVDGWVDSIEKIFNKLLSEAEALGYSKVPAPRIEKGQFIDEEHEEEMMYEALYLTQTDGSAGAYKDRKRLRELGMETKKEACARHEEEGESPVVRDALQLYLYMADTNRPIEERARACLQTVVLKDEPVKISKLMEGRHRTIGSIHWAVNLVDSRCCMFRKGDDFFTLDEVMAAVGPLKLDGATVRMEGCYSPLETFRWMQGFSSATVGDVKGWDRSLPFPVIEAMYSALCGPIGKVLARGLCLDGVYSICGEFYTWIDPQPSWCSGSLRTLSGNSIIHAALCHLVSLAFGPLEASVKGDDVAYAGVDCLRQMREVYSAVGLALQGDEFQTRGFEYVSIDTRVVPPFNMKKLESKVVARCAAIDSFELAWAEVTQGMKSIMAEALMARKSEQE